MKTEQNVLKHIFSLLLVLCVLLSLTGCKPYSTTALYVYNLTDEDIVLEENFNTEEYQTTHIPSGSKVMIGDYNRYGTVVNNVSLPEFISNPYAVAKLYIENIDGRTLVREWKFIERGEGRDFFNELFWSTITREDVSGGTHFSYIFTVTQDDIL